VTFLFTDIEGSTRLWESAADDMPQVLERHAGLLRQAIEDHRGYVFSTGGGGFAMAFGDAEAALGAALSRR
jgi:class 3 adenylate cyclase